MVEIENRLWVEKYRSKSLDDYVWSSPDQKAQVEYWIKEKEIPNLGFWGLAGTGKTTLAKLILRELEVDPYDIKVVNASQENGVDFIRSLSSFAETMPSGNFRYVLLDESDFITANGQAALRNMIEEYSSICRWIFTANNSSKIIPPLHSRLQDFTFTQLDKDQFISRVATILLNEGVDLNGENFEILEEYVAVTYPDLRKCINSLQQNCINKILKRPTNSGNHTLDYMIESIQLFKKKKFKEARELICKNARPEDYNTIYKMMYQNLDWWGSSIREQEQAIVIISNHLRDHTMIGDPEINLAACIVELKSVSG